MLPSPNASLDARSWIGLIALGSLWGSSFFFFEIALEAFGPVTVACGRVTIAALTLAGVLAVAGQSLPRDPRFWAAIAVMGTLNNALPFALIAGAQTEIDSGLASILNATTPIFSVLLAALVVRQETLTSNRALGIVLGFAGVVALIGPDALSPVGVSPLAQSLVLFAALSYATSAVFARWALAPYQPLATSFGQVATASLVLLPLALIFERPWTATPTIEAWGAVVAIGTLGTAVAYPLYFLLLRRTGATNLMLVTLINPVVAVGLGVTILGEAPAWTTFLGMALILCGLVAVDGRLLRLIHQRQTARPPP